MNRTNAQVASDFRDLLDMTDYLLSTDEPETVKREEALEEIDIFLAHLTNLKQRLLHPGYIPTAASNVKKGDIIYWKGVNADVEVTSAGPVGFYGYTFDVNWQGSIEQARFGKEDTVLVRRRDRKYRVALWKTPTAAAPTYVPVEASDAIHAAKLAMHASGETTMGVIVVMSAEQQETFFAVRGWEHGLLYERVEVSPRQSEKPFDWKEEQSHEAKH